MVCGVGENGCAVDRRTERQAPHPGPFPLRWGEGEPSRARIGPICLALGLVTLAVFWPCRTHDFLAYDDQQYVTENSHVQAGLSWRSVAWAFRSFYASNWHPVTWLSHMLDCQLYDLHAAGHHLTNVALHVATTVLLFLVLNRMTGLLWRSSCVAALFAWHPLHVESVAWVAERKDVLSAFFFMATGWAYVKYAREKGTKESGVRSQGSGGGGARTGDAPRSTLTTLHALRYYILALLVFALGLMRDRKSV